MAHKQMLPGEIEAESFAIITRELAEKGIAPDTALAPIVKRVIHTTADFDYAENLHFTPGAVERALAALRGGVRIVTDTNMARSGVNRGALAKLGVEARCYIADADVAERARAAGTTRAVAAVDKAVDGLADHPVIFAFGNAPTALLRLVELYEDGKIAPPALVIGAPVGFVNVVESKQALERSGLPAIVARGRKGGSNVAAAICNALLYLIVER